MANTAQAEVGNLREVLTVVRFAIVHIDENVLRFGVTMFDLRYYLGQ